MNTKFNTALAFLLALQELDTPLTVEEKRILADVADQLDVQPKAWDSFSEPFLVKMIEANTQLNQRYQFYKSQLAQLGELPNNLFPPADSITNELKKFVVDSPFLERGFKPESAATGYENQINNVVIVIGRSPQPEEDIKKLTFLDKVKQALGASSQ